MLLINNEDLEMLVSVGRIEEKMQKYSEHEYKEVHDEFREILNEMYQILFTLVRKATLQS